MQIRLIQGWLPWFMGLPQIVSFIFIYLVVVRPTEPQTGLPLLTVHRHAHGTHAAQRTHARRDERHLHEYDSFTDPATALACVPRALRRLESATAFQSGHRPTKSCMQSNGKFYPPSGTTTVVVATRSLSRGWAQSSHASSMRDSEARRRWTRPLALQSCRRPKSCTMPYSTASPSL